MREERRSGVVQLSKGANPFAGRSAGNSTKPYDIAKRAVWEAYQQVRANRGAAGIDDETIAMFEQNLPKNLYKLWNRMSSGSYFPPPVKQVEIPKAKGGTRKLGIPTVADRIAQTVVKRIIEPKLDPMFHPDSYGYRNGDSLTRPTANRQNSSPNRGKSPGNCPKGAGSPLPLGLAARHRAQKVGPRPPESSDSAPYPTNRTRRSAISRRKTPLGRVHLSPTFQS